MSVEDFQFAGGTTIGYDHRRLATNSQDAMRLSARGNHIVGVVADGCGSSPFSTLGALGGVGVACNAIHDELRTGDIGRLSWDNVTGEILNWISLLFAHFGPVEEMREIVLDYFLFTLVGFVMSDDKVVFFSFGDGSIYVNGEHFDLDPDRTNKPQYIAYNLLKAPSDCNTFEIVKELPLAELEHFMIATDGMNHLTEHADALLTGMDEPCGGPEQFWENQKFFKDEYDTRRMTKRLNVISERKPYGTFKGFLPDDTTAIVGRRKPSTDQ